MSILVIERYADLRAAIVNALSRGSYECDGADSADDAIEKLRHHHYDAILLSPTLPITSDPVMHFLIEEQPDQTPRVILMTEPDVEEAVPPADQRVLVKPFNNEQLFAKVRQP